MVNPHLEDIITFSAGIGRSFEEADSALRQAKARRENLDREGLKYNTVLYQGEPLHDPKNQSNAEPYMRILRFLQENGAGDDVLKAAEELTFDPRTGLLNKLGYETRRLQMEDIKGQGYYLIFDGNNMKRLNDNYGQSLVDRLIENSGRALVEFTRSSADRRASSKIPDKDQRKSIEDRRQNFYQEDIIALRVNGDCGDEFLVFVPIPHTPENTEIVQRMARRIQDGMYLKQLDSYKASTTRPNPSN